MATCPPPALRAASPQEGEIAQALNPPPLGEGDHAKHGGGGLTSPIPANRARGEVLADLAGRPRRLCLTLGALAEIETTFGVEGFAALSERLGKLSAKDLTVVLAALLRGGGEDLDPATTPMDFRDAAQAIAAAFTAAGG